MNNTRKVRGGPRRVVVQVTEGIVEVVLGRHLGRAHPWLCATCGRVSVRAHEGRYACPHLAGYCLGRVELAAAHWNGRDPLTQDQILQFACPD
jgi:hypothetical protein